MVLNGEHTVGSDLDIFDRVGRGVAHEEIIPFSVKSGKLFFSDEESEIRNAKVKVEFIKGYRDNPKINALFLMKGSIEGR